MFRYTLLALLIVAAYTGGPTSEYFLSPALPPTAFLGQFYTTQFRVLGLDNPIFAFEGLPSCFTGYKDGTIDGTPKEAGSFSVKVHFSTHDCKSSSDIVIRVAHSVSSTEGLNSEKGVLALNQFIVVGPNSSFTYCVGDNIGLNLGARNGKGPYTWNYRNLPSELIGSKDGKITGAFKQEGYYSFSASANDASGESADSYFTFNVQPKTLVKSSVLLEVPNRNVPVVYNLGQVEAQQLAANNAVYAAIRVVNEEQREAAAKRNARGKTTLALQFATAQESAAEAKTASALNAKNLAEGVALKAHEVLEAANNIVQLAKLNLKNAQKVTSDAHENLEHAQHELDESADRLKVANNKFINAQTMTAQAAQNAKAALTATLNAQNVYNLAFTAYSNAKKILTTAQATKQQADLIVDSTKNALNLANQANDNAQSDLTVAQNVYNAAYSALNGANTLVSQLREQLDDAGKQLGVAKFNLQQANNNLFVAQARKEQADKATAIIQKQSSALPDVNSTSTYIFSGCQEGAYPTFVGSAFINKANTIGYELSSGDTLLFGSCTQADTSCKSGDIIQYSGYLKDGFIHATTFKKYKGA